MRCIIAGSRSGFRYREVERAVRESGMWDRIRVVLSGGADGVDYFGERWAEQNAREIEHYRVTEDEWRRHGKAAGPMRNRRMAEAADALIAVWDGESRGTKNMIFEAQRLGLEVYVYRALTPDSESENGAAARPQEGSGQE